MLNVYLLFYAVGKLPVSFWGKNIILLIALIETLTSIQNLQFNPMLCSWIILTYVAIKNNQLSLAAFLIIYLKIPQKIEELSFILIASFLLYYFTFILIPAEGPQFYFPFPENTIEAKGIFGNMVKLIQKNGEVPTAAFPSSHVGISWIVIFWLYQNFRKSVKYFIPFVVLLMFSTVYIKAHYFVDVVAGFISAPIVFFLTFKFYKFLNHKLDVRFN